MPNGMELVPVVQRIVLPEEFDKIEVIDIDAIPGPSAGFEPTPGPSGIKRKANVRAKKKVALIDHDYVVADENACDEEDDDDEEYEPEEVGSKRTVKRVRQLKLKVRLHIVR